MWVGYYLEADMSKTKKSARMEHKSGGVSRDGYQWQDLALIQLIRKSESLPQETYLKKKYLEMREGGDIREVKENSMMLGLRWTIQKQTEDRYAEAESGLRVEGERATAGEKTMSEVKVKKERAQCSGSGGHF